VPRRIVIAVTAAVSAAAVLLLGGALRDSQGAARARAAASTSPGAQPATRTDAEVRRLQAELRRQPNDAKSLGALGLAYEQRARETADPTYLTKADGVLRRALRLDPRSAEATIGLGSLALSRHQFGRALVLGRRAHRLAPAAGLPYGIVGDAQIELGRYRAAERTLQRFLDLKPNLASYSRVSYYRELNGDLDGAVEAMRLAVSAGAGLPENVAYVQTLLGDLELQRGRPAAARAAYRGALTRLPRYAPAEAGLASVAQRLPLTSNLILLAETNTARGDERGAEVDLEVVRTQQRLLRAAGTRPDAELVVFEANYGDAGAAVELGRRLWREAPSVRSADALGWALTRAGRPGGGLAWARRALRLGSRDPLFHLHAGLAAKAAGRAGTAARELRTALAGRAALSPLRAREARAALEELR
jgi:tetratricopeptide (TPR) repeat protein